MTTFDAARAEIRFGLGVKAEMPPTTSVEVMLARLEGADVIANTFPIVKFDTYREDLLAEGLIGKAARQENKAARQVLAKTIRKRTRRDQLSWFRATLSRRLETSDGLRERLAFFWADHFTAVGKNGPLKALHAPYVEEAIRPHITRNFADMLKAVIRQPLMLAYLDQLRSAGPNSRAAQRRNRISGLNENLAREMLELHTLGVDGTYQQNDVRELAELLTGLSFDPARGFVFRKTMAEPGQELVLGNRYGDGLAGIDAVLEDLAMHPQTARHLARKLAVHFVSDDPDSALLEAMEVAYLKHGGSLMPVYEAMLTHASSWKGDGGNVKQPIDFMSSSLRAIGCGQAQIAGLKPKDILRGFVQPLSLMGQTWERPLGPDGWPEDDRAWVTPQRFAARMQWAMTVPGKLVQPLPDPREIVRKVFADTVPETLKFAASAAEDRAAGIGLILSSPAFQRM